MIKVTIRALQIFVIGVPVAFALLVIGMALWGIGDAIIGAMT